MCKLCVYIKQYNKKGAYLNTVYLYKGYNILLRLEWGAVDSTVLYLVVVLYYTLDLRLGN